jgi:hypothetical protein
MVTDATNLGIPKALLTRSFNRVFDHINGTSQWLHCVYCQDLSTDYSEGYSPVVAQEFPCFSCSPNVYFRVHRKPSTEPVGLGAWFESRPGHLLS